MSDAKDNENKSNKRRQADVNSDTAEDAVVIENDSASDTTFTPDSPAKPKARTGALWFFTVLNFLLVAILLAGAYWYWTQTQAKLTVENTAIDRLSSDITNVQTSFSRQLRGVESEQTDTQESIGKTAKAISNLEQEIDDVIIANQAMQKRIAELSGRRPSDWLIAEADYLVNMAGRKLYLEDDIKTAKMLLREADSRLQDLNDPALYPVRTLIASDLAALNQINNTSEASVSLAIGGLIPQVSELPLRTLRLPEPPPEQSTTPSDNLTDWQQNLKRTWKGVVGDFIKITPIDAPIEPYLAERQQWLIEQQLKYALSRAQTAALKRQDAIYEQSLQEALSLIAEHYKVTTPRVEQFIAALEQLLNTDFTKQYPEGLSSQRALKEVIEQRIESRFNNSGSSL